jgi:hypothetical protein
LNRAHSNKATFGSKVAAFQRLSRCPLSMRLGSRESQDLLGPIGTR